MSFNQATLLGNVGADPEIRTTNSGDRVATFRIATSETWKDKATGERKETTEWHTIVCWNQALVGVIEQYVRKGAKVLVSGQIKTRKWQAQDGSDRWTTEIVIGRFTGQLSLEGAPPGARRDEHAYGETRPKPSVAQPAPASAASPAARPGAVDDDIPF